MPISSRTALLGFTLALAALTASAAAQAALLPSPASGATIEQRLQRISAAFRAQTEGGGAGGLPPAISGWPTASPTPAGADGAMWPAAAAS
ncbi:MAG: rSAM-associated Gly-rich repeat protein [Cyanobacteria bacterium K_Offshore_surface_m2_011]|nr:rSAM-associated Gly-rich repeat protein [Cyanobacteria bacterium K_Offshore_surface_m2_011]